MNAAIPISRFAGQHTLAKLFFVCAGFVTIALATPLQLCSIFFVLALYYMLDVTIIPVIVHTLIKLIPLFISLFLMGIIFAAPFPVQALLSARIALIVTLSAYCVRTTSPHRVFRDAAPLLTISFFEDLVVFFAATIAFIPLFQDAYRALPTGRSFLRNVIKAIEQVFSQLSAIEQRISNNTFAQEFAPSRPVYTIYAIAGAFILISIVLFVRF